MTTAVTADHARRSLVDTLTANGSLTNPAWIDAFGAVPREVFVPRFSIRTNAGRLVLADGDPGYLEAVYADATLVTRWDAASTAVSSSSEPSLMARMLCALDVPAGARVLEIGTGTGYNTALLCHHLGDRNVTTIDVDPALTTLATERLAAAGHHPHVITGDGTASHPDGAAPYDGILATCGVHRVPPAWLAQVRPGGVIVTNISNGIARLTVTDDGTAAGRFLPAPAMFMRARPNAGHVAPAARQYAGRIATSTGQRRTAALPAGVDEDQLYRELVFATAMETWLAHHDVLALSLTDPDTGTTTHGLVHPPTNSWARITPQASGQALIEHAGPRDLWDERLRLTTEWIAAGQPGPDAYTLTVSQTGAHTLQRGDHAPATWTTT